MWKTYFYGETYMWEYSVQYTKEQQLFFTVQLFAQDICVWNTMPTIAVDAPAMWPFSIVTQVSFSLLTIILQPHTILKVWIFSRKRGMRFCFCIAAAEPNGFNTSDCLDSLPYHDKKFNDDVKSFLLCLFIVVGTWFKNNLHSVYLEIMTKAVKWQTWHDHLLTTD